MFFSERFPIFGEPQGGGGWVAVAQGEEQGVKNIYRRLVEVLEWFRVDWEGGGSVNLRENA